MEQVFETVLTAGFHGSVVILAVLLLRLLLRKTQKKFLCLLWVLAFVRLLLPFEIQSSLSLQPEMEPVAIHREAAEPSFQQQVRPVLREEPVQQKIPEPAGQSVSRPAEEPVISAPEQRASVMTILSWTWLAVFSGFGLWSLVSYINLRLRVREAVKIKGGWECDRIETAFILGFIRPRIYIPMGMPPEIRQYILAHERTHLEKGDHWLKMFGFLALAIHWYNPLVWLAYVMLCKDIELACDERVVRFMDLSERKAYSAALLTCSTNRVHLAACPVAFGEVSVKERIRTVLNYKKPSFWISLLGVLAIVFVAVCFVTSPAGEKEAPAEQEKAQAEPRPPVGDGYASTLTLDQIPWAAKDAVTELESRDSYLVQFTQHTTSDGETIERVGHRRKYRDNFSYIVEQTNADDSSYLIYDGQFAGAGEAGLVWMGNAGENNQAWLDFYSPNFVSVDYPEGSGVVSGDTVAFHAQCRSDQLPVDYDGSFTYSFREDGALAGLTAVIRYPADEGGEVIREYTLEVLEEEPLETKRILDEAAQGVLSPEESERIRREKDYVLEIPSNRTDYDRDFTLGASQMGWELMDGQWFMKFGAENVEATSLELSFELSEPNGDVEGTVHSGSACVIEVLKDGKWEFYGDGPELPVEPAAIRSGVRIPLDWADTLGPLPGGFYRVGMEYTFESTGGESDTKYCYAKFRLYDGDMDACVREARQAVQDLLNAESYHITHTAWNQIGYRAPDDDMIIEEQIWKSGENYLQQGVNRSRRTNRILSAGGAMVRDGVGYSLEYNNNDVSDIASQSVVAHIDRDLMEFWSVMMELYDSMITGAERLDNEIRIHMHDDFNERFSEVEMDYFFDREGRLTEIQQIYVEKDGTRILETQMAADYDDPEGIREMTARREDGMVGSFSYEEEEKRYTRDERGVRRKNFLNTDPVTLSTPEEVISRAIRDCTLPFVAGYEPGTNIYEVFRDEGADMWKVEFTASWDDAIYQAVYLDAQGITRFTVTLDGKPL